MTIPSTNPLVPSVVYTPTDAISTDSATHTKVKKVSVANKPNLFFFLCNNCHTSSNPRNSKFFVSGRNRSSC